MRTKFKKLVIYFIHIAYKIIKKPILWYWKIFKIKTYGVRVLIVSENQIILVKHWYNSLLVTPGGGIKKYETPEEAAIREVKEETGIEIKQLDYLLGTYSNITESKNDTVYCFVVELNKKIDLSKNKFNLEIANIYWSDIDNLPQGTSRSTVKRVQEYKNKDIQKDFRVW